ncbi:adenylate/guanylate cyclase domain-containing protein [uncultured Catenibacterium sp.]|uniref:adenylate/guanylate cyclase domain-containing protein n=1 Tax=uncultured Catenibacterium sp. TaxID=286142 RepID=UPI0026373D9F|nr:adenylate/guanylate cyclase domain-containing protein [uncultured Catenibacterium sp.]
MGFSKTDFDKLDDRIKKITEQAVNEIEINSELPPTIEQLEDNNKSYSIKAAILFIDIRKSTYLTENSQAKSMVKIYRSFMRMAVDCVRKNGGVTRQFLGDRIMGVFIDSTDDKGNIVDSASDKAINAARSLLTMIDYSLNKYLKSNVNGKIIECGIGIDYGKVLVTQVGMYGLENDDNRENEVDCVWVGNTTNYASKYSDIASGGEIFISDNVFTQLSEEYKDKFIRSAKYKGSKLFQGYVAKDYYLDFSEDLVNPVKMEEDTTVQSDTFAGLADGIREIERLQKDLIKRERELAVLKDKLKKENDELRTKYLNEFDEKMEATDDKKKTEEQLKEQIQKTYAFVKEIIHGSFCYEYDYIKNIGLDRWKAIEEFYHELGKKQGFDEDTINDSVPEFIDIYAYFKKYRESYEYMVSMAKKNYIWVDINESTFKWACNQNLGYQVINEMENNLKNNKISYERIKSYEEQIHKLRGF